MAVLAQPCGKMNKSYKLICECCVPMVPHHDHHHQTIALISEWDTIKTNGRAGLTVKGALLQAAGIPQVHGAQQDSQ